MGASEEQVLDNRPRKQKAASLKITKSRGSVKPRVVHTHSPKVYKIEPEEFLDLVQKLTGLQSPAPAASPPTTFQFFESDSSPGSPQLPDQTDSESQIEQSHDHFAFGSCGIGTELGLASPMTANLLGALPSPRLVTLNFLPMLAATPKARTN